MKWLVVDDINAIHWNRNPPIISNPTLHAAIYALFHQLNSLITSNPIIRADQSNSHIVRQHRTRPCGITYSLLLLFQHQNFSNKNMANLSLVLADPNQPIIVIHITSFIIGPIESHLCDGSCTRTWSDGWRLGKMPPSIAFPIRKNQCSQRRSEMSEHKITASRKKKYVKVIAGTFNFYPGDNVRFTGMAIR